MDALAMLNILAFCACASNPQVSSDVDVRVPKPVFTSEQRIVVLRPRGDGNEDAPHSLSLDNSPSTRSRAPMMFFEQEKAAPEKQ
ncbi:hypothetical protein ARMSODRAFT_1017054 [Armillaria solidipes]|uniref:Uncharacterized protein n=1 Tax=Armillaria solidipes TaxID=1076256 RepID=A0A2H3C772_9AGAR|nr:hypothetical protein ARMSODRAFT_1017054 [Armillaria solidipes]